MIIKPITCLLFAVSVVSTQGQPVFGKKSTQVAPDPTTTEASIEPITPQVLPLDGYFGIHAVRIREKWRHDRNGLRLSTQEARNQLERAAQSETRPDLNDELYRYDHRESLKQGRAEIQGWHKLLNEKLGEKYDPEGRRRLSAIQHDEFAKHQYDGIQVLRNDVHRPWEEVRPIIQANLAQAEKYRKEALAKKHDTHRTGYGKFVEMKYNRMDDSKIPAFKSSAQAKSEREAKDKQVAV
jgi:hypothetical protein